MYSACSCDQRIVTHNELSIEVNVHVNLKFSFFGQVTVYT